VYTAEFEEMFGGLFHRRKTDNTSHLLDLEPSSGVSMVRSYFSPTDHAVAGAVLPLIEEATSTLDIAMFFFTSAPIADALQRAKERGVTVRLVLDAGGAANSSSKHRALCSSGIAVKIENWGGKSHSKWAVADAGLPHATVVLGSMNWTGAGDADNDENTLYVKDEAFARPFGTEFERQWSDLAAVPTCAAVDAEGADSSMCSSSGCSVSCTSGSCCDGIDNDYDEKLDLDDEACNCFDGLDNDADGYVDTADFECASGDDP
jgi:hypothetical protein